MIPPAYAQGSSDYLKSGIAKAERGEYQAALIDLKKSIQIDPRNYIAYYNLGNIFRDLSDWEKAINAYTHCLNIKPNDAEALNE